MNLRTFERVFSETQILNAERCVARSRGSVRADLVSATEVNDAIHRSTLSTRKVVAREANRRGLLTGIGRRPIGHEAARLAAAKSANGGDPYGGCAVPDRWKRVFARAFVRAAIHASTTDRSVTVRA